MERLTARNEKGDLLLCGEYVYGNNQDVYNAIALLEAYEDTGLEPEEIKELNHQINYLEKINRQLAQRQDYYEGINKQLEQQRDAYLEALSTREALTVRPIILQREEAKKVLNDMEVEQCKLMKK